MGTRPVRSITSIARTKNNTVQKAHVKECKQVTMTRERERDRERETEREGDATHLCTTNLQLANDTRKVEGAREREREREHVYPNERVRSGKNKCLHSHEAA